MRVLHRGKKNNIQTLKIIPKRLEVINSRAKVKKNPCIVKRNVFQAIMARGTFILNSVRNKDHSPQSENFCGLTRDKEMLVIYREGFWSWLI